MIKQKIKKNLFHTGSLQEPKGMTLMEVMIACALFVTIMAFALSFVMSSQRMISDDTRKVRLLAVGQPALERIRADLAYVKVISVSDTVISVQSMVGINSTTGETIWGAEGNADWKIKYILNASTTTSFDGTKENHDYNGDGTINSKDTFIPLALFKYVLDASDVVKIKSQLTSYSIIPQANTLNNLPQFQKVDSTGVVNTDETLNTNIKIVLWCTTLPRSERPATCLETTIHIMKTS